MVHPEVAARVEAATRLAEAMVVFGYQTGTVEDLVAGFRSSAGRDALPNQIAKARVAMMLVSSAQGHRVLTEGDAAFSLAMTGWAWQENTMEFARVAVSQTVAPSQRELDEEFEFFTEMSIWARSNGDASLAATLAGLPQLVADYQQPSTSAELLGDLPAQTTPVTRPRAQNQRFDPPRGPAANGPDPRIETARRLEATGSQGLQLGCGLMAVAAGLIGTAAVFYMFGSGVGIVGIVIAVLVLGFMFAGTK